MILIDLGNTNTKIYIGDKAKKIPTPQVFEYLDMVKEDVLLSSVVPSLTAKIETKYPNVYSISNLDYHLMFDDFKGLEMRGTDRIIGLYSAVKEVNSKVVVVDIGTCITIDVANSRQYQKGIIYPGFDMLENLLFEKIPQLPQPKRGAGMINTENQIYHGNIYGFIGAIEYLIKMVIPSDEYQLVLTGGSILKLKEEHNIDILSQFAPYKPVYKPNLIKDGLKLFIEVKSKKLDN